MQVRIRIIVEDATGVGQMQDDIAHLERCELGPGSLGLSLAEAKALLAAAQRTIVSAQAEQHAVAARPCPCCGQPRARKGPGSIVMRTLFGAVRLSSPRYYRCRCENRGRSSISPVAAALPQRSTAELVYLQSKWAALMSYGLTVQLLEEVLPFGSRPAQRSVRRQLHRVATRMEDDLGDEIAMIAGPDPGWADPAIRPGPPLTVGIDGGYVHAPEGDNRKAGWFEVIAGRSVPEQGPSKCFAMVHRLDAKPRKRVAAMLASQDLVPRQTVRFISDGGDTVRNLQRYLHAEAEHVLDWFHLTMRITVMRQIAKRLTCEGEATLAGEVDAALESIKHHLWHGNVHDALERIGYTMMDIDIADDSTARGKLAKATRELYGYVERNRAFIPNYGDRWRNGERIASAFVEATINQVVARRMVKKQQMRWTPAGAHLLLQVRTRTLNGDLRATFNQWHPDMPQAA
ncbi:MAG: ISKra4 family transposase [Parvibaculum sp.]